MMKAIVITGASTGLGAAIKKSLLEDGQDIDVVDWSLKTGVDVRLEKSIEDASSRLDATAIDILVNCAGINAIDYIQDLPEWTWDIVMDTNAKGIFLVTKALLPRLRGGTILNIISNASRIPMTASLAYNASKGAAEIMTRQMARELYQTHKIVVFGVSPNKLKGTRMSDYIDGRVQRVRGWTPEKAREYQLASLPIGEETDPATLAEFIAFLLSTKERHRYLHGCIIPYGGP